MVASGVWPAGECLEIELQRQVESCPQPAAVGSAWAESSEIGGQETLVSEGLRPSCWHCLIMARGAGSLHLPSPGSPSPAQIQPGAGAPGALRAVSGGCSPNLSPPRWSLP